MAKASDFLKRRSEARVQSETIQSSDTTPLGKNEDGTVTRASDFLRKKAAERREIIDKEYGADAYGGSGRYEADKNAGFNSWLQEVSGLSERLSSDHTDRQGAYQPADAFKKYRDDNDASIGVLQNRANSYRNYFTDNASLYDDAQIQNVMKALDEYSNYLSAAKGDLGNEYDYWAQFSDENAYNAAQEYNRKLEAFASAPSRPDAYTGDNLEGNLERVEALAALPQWSDAERAEAEEILKIWDSGDIRNGVSGWWSNLMYSITGNEEKYEGSFNTRLANALRNKEISYDDYSRISTVYANLYNKVHKNSTAVMMGLMEGTGALSLSKAIGTGLGGLMGDEAQGIMDSQYDYLDELSTYGQQTAPVAYAGGNIAGVLGLMTNIASGIGAIKGFSSLPAIAQSVISGAGALGGTTAIQGIGGAATGEQSWGDYALDVGGSAAAGAAGGALSSGIGTWGTKFLQGKGLAGNMLARTIVAGLSGSGFVLGNAAVSQPAEYLRDPKNYELEMDKLAVEALVGFAFSAFGYLTKNYTTDTASAAKVDEVDGWVKKYFNGMSPEEAQAAYRSYAKQHADVLNYTGTTDSMTPEMRARYKTLQQINAAWNRINANKGATAYKAAQEAQTRGDTAAYEQAAADFQQSVGALQAAAAESGLATAETAQAAEILNTIAAGMAGGITSEAVSGAVPTVTEAPAAIETPTAPAAPETTAQEIAATLVSAGVEPAEAEGLGESMAALVNGEQISGNKAGAIAGNDAALSVLEELTGEAINTAAPISEVKAAIRGLASPAEAAAEAPAPVDTTAQEMTVEDAAAAFNGGGMHDVINTAAVEQATTDGTLEPALTRQAPEVSAEQTNIEAVADFAETMEKAGASALTKLYNPSQNPADYIQAMNAYYNSGKASPAAEFTTKTPANPLNLAQAEAAFAAGQADAHRAQTVIAETAETGYTGIENSDPTAADLSTALTKSTRVDKNGLRYTITRIAAGYVGNIQSVKNADSMISNAKSPKYNTTPYATYEEAVDDLVQTAQVNGFLKEDGDNGRQETVAGTAGGNAAQAVDKGRGDVRRGSSGSGGLSETDAVKTQVGSFERSSNGGNERVQKRNEPGSVDDGSGTGRIRSEGSGERSVSGGNAGSAGRTDGKGDSGISKPVRVKKPKNNKSNYRITEDIDSKRPNFNDNLEAIKLVKKLESEGRKATEEERAILARYKGWGGLKQDILGWRSRELKQYMTPEEYEAAKDSILNAHYTSTRVIAGMYKAIQRMGFTGGNILEPSMGVGNFFGMLPNSLSSASKLYGVELDNITGLIAKYLYPDADIHVAGFQDVLFSDNTFDLVVGNVPFSNDIKIPYRGQTYNLHDFFFVKALDETKPGGVAALITSTGTLDKISGKTQSAIAKKANLLSAFRLPDNAFKTNAGTSVTTDLIFLQKKGEGIEDNGVEFTRVGEIDGIPVNEYYVQNPQNILGDLAYEKNMYATERVAVHATDDFEKRFDKAMNSLPKGIIGADENQTAPVKAKRRGDRGKKTFVKTSDGASVVDANGNTEKIGGKDAGIINGFLEIKQAYFSVIESERAGNLSAADDFRKRLNTAYDSFVKKYGSITSNKRLLKQDDDFTRVSGLEVVQDKGPATKSAIFSLPTVSKAKKTSAGTSEEALSITLNENGKVDIDRIAQLTGKSTDTVTDELSEDIILTPDGEYVLTSQYLSGNIYEKLAAVEGKKGFEKQAALLKATIPTPKHAKDITAQFGSHWIPEKYIAEFVSSAFKSYGAVRVEYNKELGAWDVERFYTPSTQYSTDRVSNSDIVKNTLNGKNIIVNDTTEDGHRILNKKATEAAQQKQNDLRQDFSKWIFEDASRRTDLENIFNRTLNAYAPMQYKSLSNRIDFGISPESKIKLRDYQREAVARIVYGGNTLLHHGVGTGKTATMIAAAHVLKQTGISNKPLFVVPNGKVNDFRNEILDMYPYANVLALDDKSMTPAEIQRTKSMISTGDYDYVIIYRTAFQKIAVSPDTEAAFIQAQLDDMEQSIRESGGNKNGSTMFEKNLITRKKTLEEKLKAALDKPKDNTINFEDTGIDALFVDEAHNFKKVGFATTHNISGIDSATNNITTDLYMKENYLRNRGGRIVLATATPLTNTLSEMYNMTMHVDPDALRNAGIYSFDGWLNTFADIQSQPEIAPDGKTWRIKERVRGFKSGNELIGIYRQFADVKQTKDVVKGLPKAEYVDVVCEGTDIHQALLDSFADRAGKKDPKDGMLTISNDGRAAGTDLRLLTSVMQDLYPGITDDDLDIPGSKINSAVLKIRDEYNRSAATKGTQFVFLDVGVHDGGKRYTFNLYSDLINKLVSNGIPRNEIANIQDYDGEEKRTQLYEAMNTGKVRVLIGSTAKMGEGVNAQNKVVALHHLNVPFRPDNLEQREGRAIRFGNENDSVRIYRYIQEKSFDSYLWQMIERKAAYVAQALNGGDASQLEENSEAIVNAREAKAIATGNPLIMEKFTLQDKVNKLKMLQSAFNDEQRRAAQRIVSSEDAIKSTKRVLAAAKIDAATVEKNKTDEFKIKIGSTVYDNRKEAGEALLKVKRTGKIGELYGLRIYRNDDGKICLQGEQEYPGIELSESPDGNITRLLNASAAPSKTVTWSTSSLREKEGALEDAKETIKRKFAQQSDLDKATARLFEVDTELGVIQNEVNFDEMAVPEVDDEGGDEGDDAIQMVDNDYSVANGRATYTDERIDYIIREYGASSENYAQAFVARISSRDFLKMTVSDGILQKWKNAKADGNNSELRELDIDELRDNTQAPFLVVDTETGEVVGHEGRHRMLALMDAGIKSVPIVIIDQNTKYSKKPISSMTITAQDFGKGAVNAGAKATIYDLIPTNKKYRDAIIERHGGGSGEIQFSRDVTNDGQPHPERWTAQRVGSKDTSTKPVSDIIAQIRHDFGLNVTYGHVRGTGVRGQFSQRDKGIRSRIANDLPTVCHELGHALDDRYSILGDDLTKAMHAELEKALGDLSAGYKPEQYDSEGLAEFLRQYLQNRETAAIDYPEFTKYFLGKLSGKDLALVEQLSDDVNAYYSLDADSAESSVRLREEGGPDLRTHGEKIRQMGDEFYQAWIDANHGIKLFDEANGSSVYKLATNSAYSDAIAGRIITGDLTDADGQYVGPGLKTVLNGINTRNKKEYKAFGEYLIMRHGPEYLAEGKRVFADDRKNSTAFMQRRQMELEQQYPQFEPAAKRLYQFLADLNKAWGVDTQVIGADQLAEWQQRWPNYVPFNRSLAKTGRAGAKRGYANQTSPYKRAKGSGLDIVHPVDNIIDQIVLLVNVGVRNNVMYELRNAALDKGADASLMEKIPTPMVPKSFDMTGVKAQLGEAFKDSDLEADDKIMADRIISNLSDVMLQFSRGKAHGNVVTVMVNGKPEFWKINDKLLLESITSMTPAKLHGWLEAYAVTTRFMTANITGNNPVWSIFSNAPRDLGTFAVYSKDKRPFKALAAIGSGYVNAFNERFRGGRGINPLYAEYLAMGGGHTSAYSADADLARKARKKLTTTTAQRVLDTMNPVNWVTFISDTIEQGPRFATYKLMRQAGLSPQEAFYEAMDVTTNFRRAGYMSRDVNKAVPFFNASVQGIDKFNRYFTGEDAPQGERAKTVRNRWIAFFTASAILAAIMYALNSHDDESAKDYQQLSNYTKNSYWCIPLGDGKYFAIPKPRELAVMTSFFETCMESYIGGNEHAFDEFYDYATDNFLPSVVSDLAQLPSNIAQSGAQQGLIDTAAGALGSAGLFGVGAYMVANRDFLGKPIESATMRYLEPKDRYNSSTSKMAYWMGQAFNLSPAMVDYFGNQVLGYVWKVPIALFPVGQDPDYSLGVKSTYVKDNAYSQDLINWMYDQADGSSQAKKSDPENMDKAITAKLDSSMTEFYSSFNTLNKDKTDTNERRHTRQVVLDMISEYRQASESGETTRAQDAVYAVVRSTGETSYMPSVMNTFVKDGDDVKHTLTDEQYVTYQTRYLALYWGYAEQNLATGMSTKEKAAVLTAAKDVAKEGATNAVLSQIGAPKTAYAEKYADISTDDVIEYKAKLTAETDGSPKQEEIISILEAMISEGLTYDEAYLLFRTEYDSDKNNPWKKYAP